MKVGIFLTFLTGLACGIVGTVFTLLPFKDETPCTKSMAQQQAGYQVVVATQRLFLEQETERKVAAEVRSITEHAALIRLQQEFGTVLAARVVIPEPTPMLVSQVDSVPTPSASAMFLPISKELWKWAPALIGRK